MSGLTAPQTVGPFFSGALLRNDARAVAAPDEPGRHIRIEGRVLDGEGEGVPDAMVEVWQADAQGRYNHPADGRVGDGGATFLGWGRAGTDDTGGYWFTTVVPGEVASPAGEPQAPHLVVQVFARGLLDHVTTRLYFADVPATAHDPLLGAVAPERRRTLLAIPDGDGTYRFDIVLQGPGETVFFDVAGRRGGT